ncbi:cystatin-F [Pelodiscus sinensis]|uniref:cystatin-F n=1 Tax=Pelodiscus sinensis TaxID=13735 RepID=UPI003F6CBB11
MRFGWGLAVLCYFSLWDSAWSATAPYLQKPDSTAPPGFPRVLDPHDPRVRTAARFGVYRYNNSSNDLFLFRESRITRALVQVVRGLKYMIHVEISRTVCDKRGHSNLDSCDFQKKKKLQQMLRCYFEVWTIPWLHQVHVPVSRCR